LKGKAVFLLYRILQALASPLVLVYLLLRGSKNARYFSSLSERCGQLPPLWQQTVSASIWLHAVSVGEVLAAIPLIEDLKRRTPQTPIFVSTATLAGREIGKKRLSGLAHGVFYAPFDFVWSVRRVLRLLRPSVVIVLETEIWPNLFRESKRIGCGLILINGRISDRAFPRYRRFRSLFSPVLAHCDRILAQSEEMRRRFEEAGAPPALVEIGGNLKYDFTPAVAGADSEALRFIEADSGRPLWIAASTSVDDQCTEEHFVIAAQRKLPGWRLIIAPRKPARFEEAADLLAQSGLRWTRRTTLDDPAADVLLLDSIGELGGLFPWAKVVFMGGTLADRGGHNILEPAAFGKPVIAGPHLENFREIADHFERQKAILRIRSGEHLQEAVLAAAADPALGHRAKVAAGQEQGAAAHAADRVMALYESSYPCERPPQPAYAFLWIFALAWKAGSALDRRSKREHVSRLSVPVVSVGNITTGGTGKTPVAIELLREFREAKPGLLTRGHGRAVRDAVLLLDENERVPLSLTGDEAQLCMRDAHVPIGVGQDRYAVGKELLEAAELRVLFLDDGFQHQQLYRDFDLVLIDALRPFGGGYLVPLGRLRGPLEGLERASAFLITRADEAANTRAIEAVLRRYNAEAPVFCARTTARNWRNPDGEALAPDRLKNVRSVAFCGLGNPQSFWRTLDRIGIEPLSCYEYEDHHQYTPSEIRRLAQHARDIGAEALLTTPKDAVNLDTDYRSIIGSLKLYWLEIGIEIEERKKLLDLISSVLRQARI
jgi:3-deoxy-D-manno-octulosonic-acid transferase